jgi:hypothetical protein
MLGLALGSAGASLWQFWNSLFDAPHPELRRIDPFLLGDVLYLQLGTAPVM